MGSKVDYTQKRKIEWEKYENMEQVLGGRKQTAKGFMDGRNLFHVRDADI